MKDVTLAEDITQEAFLKCWENLDGRLEIRFLYRIAHNLCIDEYRKKQVVSLDEMPESESPDFSDTLIDNMSLKAAMDRLSEDECEMLLLRFSNNESFSVIGNLYGVSRFAAYRKVQKILKKLRQYMEEGVVNG